jgi:hypothetical protein
VDTSRGKREKTAASVDPSTPREAPEGYSDTGRTVPRRPPAPLPA